MKDVKASSFDEVQEAFGEFQEQTEDFASDDDQTLAPWSLPLLVTLARV